MNRAAEILTALVLGAARAASGHHGIVNFDMNKEVEVTGTVTRWRSSIRTRGCTSM
jgi:hypothetical protein